MNNKLKISIITPTNNSAISISENLTSIFKQDYKNWELIIVDNLSTDKTLDIIKKKNKKKIKILSEKDNGIYDAINKGIKLATGNIISILHSDDFYYNNFVLSDVINTFNQSKIDAVYGDLLYVKKSTTTKILRFWKSKQFKKGDFYKGWSPAHPSFFIKRNLYKKLGYYKNNLGNSADFELMYRYLEKNNIKSKYINNIFVTMRYGGSSNKNFYSILKQNITIIKILNIKYNPIKLIIFMGAKIRNRLMQFIIRPD